MTTSLRNTFVGGTSGTAITAGNSGGTSGDAFDAAANLTYASVTVASGTYLVGQVVNSSAQSVVRWNNRTIDQYLKARVVFSLSAVPQNADVAVIRCAAGSTVATEGGGAFSVGVTITGKLRIYAAGSGSSVQAYIGTTTIPTDGRELRLEVYATSGTAGNANGSIRATVYDGRNSTTPLDDSTLLTGQNLIGSNSGFENMRAGKYGGDVYTGTLNVFDVKYQGDTSSTLSNAADPVSGSTPLSLSLGLSPTSGTLPYTITATGTATGGTNINRTFAMDWGDGTTSAAQTSNVFTKQITGSSSFSNRTATMTVSEDSA